MGWNSAPPPNNAPRPAAPTRSWPIPREPSREIPEESASVEISLDSSSFSQATTADLDEACGTWRAELGVLAKGSHTRHARAGTRSTRTLWAMPSNAVPGFLPSRHGFRFRNQWPAQPARTIGVGPLRIPLGDTSRGLCGGMVFAARALFDRGEDAPADAAPPPAGTALFTEIVDRQFDSFGRLFMVPLRFWLAAMPIRGQAARDRETVRDAWPAIKAAIDRGEPAMVGLVRLATWNPLAPLGHQVVAYRYEEAPTGMRLDVYDPNHPGRDDVTLTVERNADGSYAMRQSTGEGLIGLLALPYSPGR